jgi:hypothetical protein
MCFMAVAVAASLAAAAASAAGGMVAAKGHKEAGRAAEQEADYKARVAELNRQNARYEAAGRGEKIADDADRLASSQRAAAAASGRNPDSGSAALLLADTEKNKQLDLMSNLWSANREADAYTHEAAGLRVAGANAKRASKYAARGSFLSGLGGAASNVGQAASTRINA